MERFLEKNSAYWRKRGGLGERSRGTVLVDMLVGHPGYLMSSAIIGKYLQIYKGYEVTALVPSASSARAIKNIAVSYGITQFVHEDDPISLVRQKEVQAWALEMRNKGLLRFNDKDSARRSVVNLEFDGVPIGDLIIDMYLRNTGQPTVLDPPHFFDHGFQPALARLARALTLLDGLTVSAAVMGHTVYDRYGLLTRFILHRGGRVYSRQFSAPPYFLRAADTIEEVLFPPIYLKPEEIAVVGNTLGDEACEVAREDMRCRLAGAQSHAQSATEAFTSDKRTYSRAELAAATGTAPDKPNVFIMSQCLSDAPHYAPGLVFDDYAEWICRTAEFCRSRPDINWIFKEHPGQKYFSDSWTCERLIGPYRNEAPHIALCPPDLTQRNMTEIIDAAVCVHDAGVEFAVHGIPTVNPALGMTVAAGLATQPRDREHYFSLLVEAAYAPRLTAEQIRHAELLWYAFKKGAVPCDFIPEHDSAWFHMEEANKVFERAEERLSWARVEQDPLFLNIREMLQRREKFLHNYVSLGLNKKPEKDAE